MYHFSTIADHGTQHREDTFFDLEMKGSTNRSSAVLHLVLHGYLLTFSLRGVGEQWVVAIVQIVIGQGVALGILDHGFWLCFVHRIRSRRSFHVAIDLCFAGASQDTGRYGLLPVVTSLWDDEDVKPTGHHESEHTPHQQEMSDDETHDVERVVIEAFEGGICETEDDGEDGAGEVSQKRSPNRGQRPVRATTDDGV